MVIERHISLNARRRQMTERPGWGAQAEGEAARIEGAPQDPPTLAFPQQPGQAQAFPAQALPAQAPPAQDWAPVPAPQYAPVGYPQQFPQAGYMPQMAASTASNGMAVASLVLGITSIVFCWWGLATLAQVILAIVFGIKGMNQAAAAAPGRGMAVAGTVLGCVGGLIYLLLSIFTSGVLFLI
jgi:hypothetical protein